jgi:serine protease AprX
MRNKVQRVIIAVIGVGLLTSASASRISPAGSNRPRAVIVQGADAAAAVRSVGGKPTLALDLIGGVGATVPGREIARLQEQGFMVSPDATARVASDSYPSSAADTQAAALESSPSAGPDAGRGVAVALLDTGVARTTDLTGRLIRGPDFSGEGDGIDHYGHGTFMAGLIAGDGTASAATGGPVHRGIAPGATVVSIKVAGADGSTSLSKVIAGIGWAIVHQDDFGIRVLSLSIGVDTTGSYRRDPLSAAVEVAWTSGLTTIVAAGNEGPGYVTSPGRDPYVLTVGAADNTLSADPWNAAVPSWSGSATFPGYAKPDVLAPGVSVISLRAPGSTIDTRFPEARVDGDYFRGSGTSMATALTAGIAAIVTQHHPDAAPDDVKGAITSTARPVPQADLAAGEASLSAAIRATADPAWQQYFRPVLAHLTFPWEDEPWSGSRWSGSRWSGSRWSGSRWSAADWAELWAGSRWSDVDWAGSRWSGSRWSAATWGTDGP